MHSAPRFEVASRPKTVAPRASLLADSGRLVLLAIGGFALVRMALLFFNIG